MGLIPVDEYLNTSYDPDVEYVDGALVERNIGDWPQSLIQSNIIYHLSRKFPGVYALPALTSQTKNTRYRLPDVSVLLAVPKTKYLLEAAFLTVIDPRLRKMFTFRSHTLREVEDVISTDDPRLELTGEEVFQD